MKECQRLKDEEKMEVLQHINLVTCNLYSFFRDMYYDNCMKKYKCFHLTIMVYISNKNKAELDTQSNLY